jgi:Domain of unknown function (DUF222)
VRRPAGWPSSQRGLCTTSPGVRDCRRLRLVCRYAGDWWRVCGAGPDCRIRQGRVRFRWLVGRVDRRLDRMVDSLTRLSLVSADPDVGDAVRIDRIAVLERLQAAAFAAQAAEMARFADAREAEQRRVGVPARRVGVGIADQVALACRVSPVTGARRLGLARILIAQLPSTYALLTRGQISAWVASVVARETDALTPADRAVVDARLAGTLGPCSPHPPATPTNPRPHLPWDKGSSRHPDGGLGTTVLEAVVLLAVAVQLREPRPAASDRLPCDWRA